MSLIEFMLIFILSRIYDIFQKNHYKLNIDRVTFLEPLIPFPRKRNNRNTFILNQFSEQPQQLYQINIYIFILYFKIDTD